MHRRDRLPAPAGDRTPHYRPRHAQPGPLAARAAAVGGAARALCLGPGRRAVFAGELA